MYLSEENFAFEWIDDVNRSPRYGYPFISINPTNRIKATVKPTIVFSFLVINFLI